MLRNRHTKNQIFKTPKQIEAEHMETLIIQAKKMTKIYNDSGEYNLRIPYDGVNQEALDFIFQCIKDLDYQDNKYIFAITLINYLPRFEVRKLFDKFQNAVSQITKDCFLGNPAAKEKFEETLYAKMRMSKSEKENEIESNSTCFIM